MTERAKVPHWPYVVVAVSAAVMAAVLAWAVFYGSGQREQNEASTAEKVTLAEQVRQACAAGGEAAKELGDACSKAREITERPVGEKGDPGATGPRGPQGIQGARGPQGPPGLRGQAGATPPCMLVSTRCQGRPGATGQPGSEGVAGPQGKDGEAGPAGPQGEQGPQGIQGAQGDQGPQGVKGDPCQAVDPDCVGPAGRGVQSMACVDDGPAPANGAHWVVTYTDNTTQTLPEGSCRQPAVPSIPGGT
jgi:hypothetical protein